MMKQILEMNEQACCFSTDGWLALLAVSTNGLIPPLTTLLQYVVKTPDSLRERQHVTDSQPPLTG